MEKIAGPGVVQDQRPYVSIRINDKLKETELADWSPEKEQWCFREAPRWRLEACSSVAEVITLEVLPEDEIFVAVSSSTKYDFWLASVQLTNTKLGEAMSTGHKDMCGHSLCDMPGCASLTYIYTFQGLFPQ